MKILVVEPTAVWRRALSRCLGEIGAKVISARGVREARDQVEIGDLDAMILSGNAPDVAALPGLQKVITGTRLPVVMMWGPGNPPFDDALRVLDQAAVACIETPDIANSAALARWQVDVQTKLRAAAQSRLERRAPAIKPLVPVRPKTARSAHPIKLVMIGVSTGGPKTLHHVLGGISPALAAPILIALHMPNRFVAPLARRLQSATGLSVTGLQQQARLVPGKVVIAGADTDVTVSCQSGRAAAQQVPIDPARPWHPCIDRMVTSAMRAFRAQNLVAVQLTGMGNDGANAMTELRYDGGFTIAEAQETSVVFGMPKALVAQGGASRVLANDKIGAELNAYVGLSDRHVASA